MVKKFLSILHKEIGGLHQAAYILAVFSFGSQLLALLRDRLLAHIFGAGVELDVYYAAFRIPDFIFVLVASIVSVSVMIPFLAERIDRNLADAKRFINNLFTFFSLAVVLIGLVFLIAMPVVVDIFFPGFSQSAQSELVILSRVLLLSPVILGVSNIFGSITQIHKRFGLYASSPVLYNLGIILGIVFLAPTFGIKGVVLGVVIGALLHLVIQIPFAIKVGILPSFIWPLDIQTIKRVFVLSVPRTFTLGINHLVILILIGVASLMSTGSVSIFSFSYNLQSVPLSIIGVSYSLAAFPTLSRLFVGGQTDKFIDYITTSARHIIFWSIPIMVLFIVLRAQIVRIILGSGEFSWTDTRLTAAALALFSVSVVFQSLVLLFVRGFYSAGKTRAPLVLAVLSGFISLVGVFVIQIFFEKNILFQYFLESLFRINDLPGTEVIVLPLAFSLGAFVNAVGLWILFRKDFGCFSSSLSRVFFQSLSSGVIAGAVSWVFLNILDDMVDISTFWGIFTQGLVSGIFGILTMVLIFWILGSRELKDFWQNIRKRIWKDVDIVGPDPDITS